MMNRSPMKILSSMILFFIILACLPACKKEKEENIKYRLIGRDIYVNDTLLSQGMFHYLDNKIEEIKMYDYTYGGDSLKTEVEYTDANTTVQLTSVYYGLIYWIPILKTITESSDGKIVYFESQYFDGSYWITQNKREYHYNGINLAWEEWYEKDYGTWYPVIKIEYSYDQENLVKTDYFSYDTTWQLSYSENVEYLEGRVNQVIGYAYVDSSFQTDSKYTYYYNGDEIARIESYFFAFQVWNSAATLKFSYDVHGNLATESYSESGYSERYEYLYEAGAGNYNDLRSIGGGTLNINYYPSPTKRSMLKSFMERSTSQVTSQVPYN